MTKRSEDVMVPARSMSSAANTQTPPALFAVPEPATTVETRNTRVSEGPGEAGNAGSRAQRGGVLSETRKGVSFRGWRERFRQVLVEEKGAVTAEYAIIIMAAVAFAGVLVAIIRSEQIRELLVKLVENALGSAG